MTLKGFRLTTRKTIPLDIHASTLDGMTASLSDGFYTTFSTLSHGQKVLGLRAHLERLYKPAQVHNLHPSVDETALRHRLAELVKGNLPRESRVRLILTGDTGDVYLGIQPFIPTPESAYRDGVHVITADMARHDPRVKGTDFIAQSAEQRKLVKGDVYEILLTHHGKILEGMTSNFYAVICAAGRVAASEAGGVSRPAGVLITAQKGILLGVTRRIVLRLARGEGMSIEYRFPRLDETFDEAFLTSSSRGIVPIVSIDNVAVGQGKLGAWTKCLSLEYQAYVAERSEWIVPP